MRIKRESYDISYLFYELEDIGNIQEYAYGKEIVELLDTKAIIFMEEYEGKCFAEIIKTPTDLYNHLRNWNDEKAIFVIEDKNRKETLVAKEDLIEIFNFTKEKLIEHIMNIPVDISFEDLCGEKGYVSNGKWIEDALADGKIDDLRNLYEKISKFH